jgi:hypothetical protein
MVRFGFSRTRHDFSTPAGSAARTESGRDTPSFREINFQIGLVLALHLGFVLVVLLTLEAYRLT